MNPNNLLQNDLQRKVACIWFYEPAPTQTLAELFLRFSPQICILNDKAIFIEIGKSKNLFNEEEFLIETNKLLLLAGRKAKVTFGFDITDSLVLAKYNHSSIDAAPLTALLDLADPFQSDQHLKKNILKMINTFQDLGITTVSQFKRLPVGDLIARFGIVGRFVYQRIHLSDFTNWPLWKPEEIIEETKEFSYFEFYGELDPIIFELKSQLDLVFERLRSRNTRVMKLRVQVRCERNSNHPNFLRTFDFDFFAPQSLVKGTLKILRERLAREFEKCPVRSPIEAIKTTVQKTTPFNNGQKNIFNDDEEKTEQLYSVHNQLAELVGKENVYQAELTEDRRPERSWIKNFDRPHQAADLNQDFVQTLPSRVPILCDHPIKVDITAGFIHINKNRYKIREWGHQIEKIVGGWSELAQTELKHTYNRSYSLVLLEDGRKLYVFQTPDRNFFLHGYSA